MSFRRRALELRRSAARERVHDPDSGALLLFYAVECVLKFIYMSDNMLRSSNDSRAGLMSAKDIGHDIVRLINELRIPRSAIPATPTLHLHRTGVVCAPMHAHQAWRYGEKLDDFQAVWDWLSGIMDYCEGRL